MDKPVLVYGAYGHTGRFVVAELLRQGLTPILSGRSPAGLDKVAGQFPGLEVRPATVDNSHSLENAVRGAGLVVNCAGPFLDTAVPVAAAAVRAEAHYLDVTAEQAAVQEVYRAHEKLGWSTDLAVIPAMAFYGGLADLLATAAAAGWETLDEITVAVGLDRWWPTEGTRNTGRRNSATRLVVDVVVRRAEEERRISAAGRDIYAVTAPLVVEATRRLIDGRAKVQGAAAPGEVFDAADFLDALSPHHLTIRREGPRSRS